ncbi:MAG: alpha/beta hydrolase [Flavobacteriales bacterium]|nr:alpha/beta hydrolase [Flavobacteriales bacterium]
MKKLMTLTLFLTSLVAFAQTKHIYCIPGTGTDYRIFTKMVFDTGYVVHYVDYVLPDSGSSMNDYAHKLAEQIDTTQPYIIIGASLGGMLAVEMADFLHPEKVILIASAKTVDELPYRYKFQKKVPIQRLVSGEVIKTSTLILQPLVEPDRNKEKETFIAMLHDKDPIFMKRAVDMILDWERTEYDSTLIVHIHGNHDKTIPYRNVTADYTIEKGSHVMCFTRSEEISAIVREVLP